MLDLTPSLQYTAIAALSPKLTDEQPRGSSRRAVGHVGILPDTQEGAVPHQGRPARIPWSVGVRVR
eukprot:1743978-Prymnesium_polylepis.1